jgi:hypothetical protein
VVPIFCRFRVFGQRYSTHVSGQGVIFETQSRIYTVLYPRTKLKTSVSVSGGGRGGKMGTWGSDATFPGIC